MVKLFWLCLVLLSIIASVEGACNEVIYRKEYRDTTVEEWNLFREALFRLQSKPSSQPGLSEWDLFTFKHFTHSKPIHGNVYFLPWHRAFLRDFERKLRSLDPKFAKVYIPYWSASYDWLDALASPIFDPNSRFNLSVVPDDGETDDYPGDCNYPRGHPEAHCLLREYRKDLFSLFPSTEVTAMLIVKETNFSIFSSRIEGLHHGLIHVSLGGAYGDLTSMSSPNDPIFWMLHSSLDRIWSLWQKLNANRQQFPPSGLNVPVPGYRNVYYRNLLSCAALCYDFQPFSQDEQLTIPALLARQSSGAEDPIVTPTASVDCRPKPLPKEWIEKNGMSEEQVRDSERVMLDLISRSKSSKLCASGNAISQTGATPESADGNTQTSSRVTVTTGSMEAVPGWAVGLLVLGAIVLATLLGILVVVLRR